MSTLATPFFTKFTFLLAAPSSRLACCLRSVLFRSDRSSGESFSRLPPSSPSSFVHFSCPCSTSLYPLQDRSPDWSRPNPALSPSCHSACSPSLAPRPGPIFGPPLYSSPAVSAPSSTCPQINSLRIHSQVDLLQPQTLPTPLLAKILLIAASYLVQI